MCLNLWIQKLIFLLGDSFYSFYYSSLHSSCALYVYTLISECIVIICLKKYPITCYEHTTGINKVLHSEQIMGLWPIIKKSGIEKNNINVTEEDQELYLPMLTMYIDYILYLVLDFSPFYQSTTVSCCCVNLPLYGNIFLTIRLPLIWKKTNFTLAKLPTLYRYIFYC